MLRCSACSAATVLAAALLLTPTIAHAAPPGQPPLPILADSLRVKLLKALDHRNIDPWQRDIMRALAGDPAAPGAKHTAPAPRIEGLPGRRLPRPQSGGNIRLYPDAQGFAAAIYDSVRDRLILMGAGGGQDLWQLNFAGLAGWQKLVPDDSGPSPRTQVSAIYDPVGDRMVVFGGAAELGNSNEVWLLPLSGSLTWALANPLGPLPGPRHGHVAIYDPQKQRMVMFGGSGQDRSTWALSLNGTPEWSQLAARGDSIPATYGAAAAFDPLRNRLVIFSKQDLWSLDLQRDSAWVRLSPRDSPVVPRDYANLIYNPTFDRFILFGGESGGGPAFDDKGAWQFQPSAGEWAPSSVGPGGYHLSRMTAVYESLRERIVVFGGWWPGLFSGDPNTYFTNRAYAFAVGNAASDENFPNCPSNMGVEGTWASLPQTPAGRTEHSTVYDSKRNRILVFGGSDFSNYLNDTWVLSLDGTPNWSQLATVGPLPAPRVLHSAIYDPVRDRMLIFGGYQNGTYYNDTWSLSLGDNPTWSLIAPPGTYPNGRIGSSAVYDPIRDRMLVFGGDSTGIFCFECVPGRTECRAYDYIESDLWALSLAGEPQWSELAADGPPGPRYGQSIIYDPVRDRLVVYGGNFIRREVPRGYYCHHCCPYEANNYPYSDTWALPLGDPLRWNLLDPGICGPAPRHYAPAVYDESRDRMVIVGGSFASDDWALELAGESHWISLGSPAPRPVPRASSSGVYIPATHQVILYGGQSAQTGYGYADTWELTPPANSSDLGVSTPRDLPPGIEGHAYHLQLAASGGTPPYRWIAAQSGLPSGLTLSPNGLLSGSTTAGGAFCFTVGLTDAAGSSVAKSLALSVNPLASIVTTSLPDAVLRQPYSQQLQAKDGSPPYQWNVVSGSLPQGMNLDPGGLIHGSGWLPGTSTVTVQLTDGIGTIRTRALALTVKTLPLQIPDQSLQPGAVGIAYHQRLAASGGLPPYHWVIGGGTLPPGLTLAMDGELNGMLSSAGTFYFRTVVADSIGQTTSGDFALLVNGPLNIVTSARLPDASVGDVYSLNLVAGGGVPSYAWRLVSGHLPSGLALDTSGQINGVATGPDSANFTAEVQDQSATRVQKSFTLKAGVLALRFVTPPDLSTAQLRSFYSQTLIITGGVPAYRVILVSGSLPDGLSLVEPGGLAIQGTPTLEGTSLFTLSATDAQGASVSQIFSIAVNNDFLISTGSQLPAGETGISYFVPLVTIRGVPPYQWAVSSGGVPGGISLDSSGVIRGIPQVSGQFGFSVRVTDSRGVSAVRSFVCPILPPVKVDVSATLPGGQVGIGYYQLLPSQGGAPPFRWAHVSGTLPPGLEATPTGFLTGLPTAAGVFSFEVNVTDALGATDVGTLLVGINPARLTIQTDTLPGGVFGATYSHSLQAVGGYPPYQWAQSSGTIPPGLTLGSDGSLAGIPSQAGAFDFAPSVTDHNGGVSTGSVSMNIAPALAVIAGPPLPAGLTGGDYSAVLSAQGGMPPYAWSLSAGRLPTGLSLRSDGVLQGAPSEAGMFRFAARVTDSTAASRERDYVLMVAARNPLFALPSSLENVAGPTFVVAGALDGDGRQELLVTGYAAGSGRTVTLFTGWPGPTISRSDLSTGLGPVAACAGRFGPMGDPAIAVVNRMSFTVSVFTGAGHSTRNDFQPAYSPEGVVSADFDGDGLADLAVANGGSNSVTVHSNLADGTFNPIATIRTGIGPIAIATGDFNGDGFPDLVTANFVGNTVSFLRNRGDGSFGRKIDFATGAGPRALAVGDFNGDGKPDIAAADSGSSSVSVLLGNGAGGFGPRTDFAVGSEPHSIVAADLDGDGALDLVTANGGSNSISMLRGNGDGTFQQRADSPTAGRPYSLAVADFNGDGRPDLAVACNGSDNVVILLNTGMSLTTPVVLTRIDAEARRDAVVLSWSALVDGAPRFEVRRAGLKDGPFARVGEEVRAMPGQRDFVFEDRAIVRGKEYFYKLESRDGGKWKEIGQLRAGVPQAELRLSSPVPNPVTGTARIGFELAQTGRALLEVYNVAGERVRTLLDAVRQQGDGSVGWDGRTDDGRNLSSGIYFVRLSQGVESRVRRVTVLK